MKNKLITTKIAGLIGIILSSSLISAKDVHVLFEKEIYTKLKEADSFEDFHIKKKKMSSSGVSIVISEESLTKLAGKTHTVLERCGGFRTFYTEKEHNEYLNEYQTKKTVSSSSKKKMGLFFNKTIALKEQDRVYSWFDQIERPRMNKMITHLSNYSTRYYTSPEGIEAMNWIYDQWQEITKGRSDVAIKKYKHSNFEQPSIILTFKSSVENAETLVFGGHGDSINTDDGPHGVAPGADDNAAGVALLTEMIQLMVNNSYQPTKNITFMVYAAEEVGILGSYEITKEYRKQNINVVGAMQFDGVNYQGPSFDMALIADLTNQAQNELLGELIDEYVQVPWTYQRCNYACSDHAAWNYEGYPVSYPVETTADEQNPHFHTSRDTFDKSNFDTLHAEKFLKLAIAYLLEKDSK